MSIWTRYFGGTKGGWKTYGPNAIDGPGGFDSADPFTDSVTADVAMRLSAVWSCMHLRAEAIGSLPLHLRDEKKKIIKDHPLYEVLHHSPNAYMTAMEFGSLATAHLDMHGNSISIIQRRTRDKSVISLEPVDPTNVTMHTRKSGGIYYKIGTEEYDDENILHYSGFSMTGRWGLPRIDIGRQILSSQLSANNSAMMAFKQGLKVGGFFKVDQNMDDVQLKDFHSRLNQYGLPENSGKYMTLLKGMEPIAGEKFRIKPAEAELLASRYFGIEEICRLFNTPPQLIGHVDKASSWASSLEQVGLYFMMYSIQPTIIRREQRNDKKLLSAADRSKGIRSKFSIEGLIRADLKTRQVFYASALQNGYYNRNEVRDLEERGEIEGGDKYTVQLNMGSVEDIGKEPEPADEPVVPPVVPPPPKSDPINITVNVADKKAQAMSITRDAQGNATVKPLEQ